MPLGSVPGDVVVGEVPRIKGGYPGPSRERAALVREERRAAQDDRAEARVGGGGSGVRKRGRLRSLLRQGALT